MRHFSALQSVPYVSAFCLERSVLYQEIQRHASVTNCSTLFLFSPPLKFELNREGERDWFLFCSHFCSGQSINSQHSEGDAGGEPQGEHMMFLFLKRWQLFSLDICQVNCTLLALKPFFDQLYDIVPGLNFYKKLYMEFVLFYYLILHFCTEPRTWHSDKYIIMITNLKVVSSL